MIYLEKIEILNNTYPGSHTLEKGFTITCKDVNLLVGDQGCGKSTLLKLIQKNHTDIKIKLNRCTIKNKVDTYYFDSEKDNPRIKDLESYTKPNGENVGIGYGGAFVTHFKSHGEVMRDFIITPLIDAKDCVIILDEPESGLSLTSQFKFIDVVNKAVENNCQFFIATHCYPLIEQYDVISLEHNEQMSGKEFINKIKIR